MAIADARAQPPPWRWLAAIVMRHRRAAATALSLSLVASVLVLLQPYLLKRVIDDGIIAHSTVTLVTYTAAMFAVSMLGLLLSGINRIRYTRLSGEVLFEIRESVYAHLQLMPPTFYARQRTGDILSRLGGDVAELQRFAIDGVLAAVSGCVGLIGAVTMAALLNWRLSLMLALLVPLQLLAQRLLRPLIERHTRRVRERSADVSAFLVETLPAMKYIQAAAAEGRERARLHRLNRDYLAGLVGLQWREFAASAIPSGFSSSARAVAFLLGGYWVIQGEMALGSLVAYSSYIGMALGPVNTLLGVYAGWYRAQVSLERIDELRREQPAAHTLASALALPAVSGQVSFHKIGYRYPGSDVAVLDQASLNISAGESVALIGVSGAGKTTVVDLLLGHLTPVAGDVTVDGCDIHRYRIGDWRRQVAVVSQDVVLFGATVADNLRYVVADAADRELRAVLHAARLGGWLESLAAGLQTPVGERGVTLSGGQRQRLAIARALLQKPVLVIFDEATSALDKATEEALLDEVDRLFTGVTRLYISHRSAAARRADRVVELVGGRFVERPRAIGDTVHG